MKARILSFVFFLNSLLAIYLLWVIGFSNGFLEHGSTACSNGTVRSDYIGISVLDEFVSRMLYSPIFGSLLTLKPAALRTCGIF